MPAGQGCGQLTECNQCMYVHQGQRQEHHSVATQSAAVLSTHSPMPVLRLPHHLLQLREEGARAEPVIQVGSQVLPRHERCAAALPPQLHGPHMRARHPQKPLPASEPPQLSEAKLSGAQAVACCRRDICFLLHASGVQPLQCSGCGTPGGGQTWAAGPLGTGTAQYGLMHIIYCCRSPYVLKLLLERRQ